MPPTTHCAAVTAVRHGQRVRPTLTPRALGNMAEQSAGAPGTNSVVSQAWDSGQELGEDTSVAMTVTA